MQAAKANSAWRTCGFLSLPAAAATAELGAWVGGLCRWVGEDAGVDFCEVAAIAPCVVRVLATVAVTELGEEPPHAANIKQTTREPAEHAQRMGERLIASWT